MRKFSGYLLCIIPCFLLTLICELSIADPYFNGSSLIDIPTAYIMNHGIFNAGVHVGIRDEKRNDTSLMMDFGFLNFAETGIVGIVRDNKEYITGNAKLILSREEGILPALAVGVNNFGESIESDQGYETSFYGVVSKQFNLPLIHIIGLHFGLGNKSYTCDESIGKYLHGFFMGLNKDWIVDSRDMRVSFIVEMKGNWVNTGLKCLMNSGIGFNLAIAQIAFGGSNKKDRSYNMGLSFTNEPIMNKMAQSVELAKQAVRIANEARFESSEGQNRD